MKKLLCVILPVLFIIGCTESTTNESTTSNNPPEIKSLSAQTDSISGLAQIQIVAFAEDPDDDELEYTWEARQGTFSGSGPIVNWTSPNAIGLKRIVCTVSDGKGGEDSDSLAIRVTSYNNQPLFISQLQLLNEGKINLGDTVRLKAVTNSRSSSSLSYRWRMLDFGSTTALNITEDSYEFKPESNGVYRCIYFVENSKNEYAYKTIDITVGDDGGTTNNNPVINKFEFSRTEFNVGDSIIVNVEYQDPDSDDTEFYFFIVGGNLSYSMGDIGENKYFIKFTNIPSSKTETHYVIAGLAKDTQNGKGYALQVVKVYR